MSRPYLDEETEQVLRRLPLRHHRSSCVLCHCRHGRLQRWSVGVVPKMIWKWDKSRKKLACDWPWGMYVPNFQSSQPWKESKDVQKALAVGSRPLSLSSLRAVKGRHQCCANPASRPHGENRDPAEPRMRNRSGKRTERRVALPSELLLVLFDLESPLRPMNSALTGWSGVGWLFLLQNVGSSRLNAKCMDPYCLKKELCPNGFCMDPAQTLAFLCCRRGEDPVKGGSNAFFYPLAI